MRDLSPRPQSWARKAPHQREMGHSRQKTLKQACLREDPRAQDAFEIRVTRGLQFALLIALCCVLLRYGNQDIHRWEFVCRGSVGARSVRLCVLWARLGVRCSRNDPAAGSPTAALLRLLLPLSGKVHTTFAPGARPKGSPDHSIGRSDGRCVQRTGT